MVLSLQDIYHIDPEIHHGIPDLISNMVLPYLHEDSISHLAPGGRPIRVNDQWMYYQTCMLLQTM